MKPIIRPSILTVLLLWSVAAMPARMLGAETYDLRSGRRPGQTDCVTGLLEVGGDRKGVVDGKIERTKMSVVCKLRYDERTLAVPDAKSQLWRSIRDYTLVDAVIKVGDDGLKPKLRPERTLVGAEVQLPKTKLFSPKGTLTRDELELIDVLGNSLVLDALLPTKPVAVGQSWPVDEKVMIALLGIDAAASVDVDCTLTKATDATTTDPMAIVELQGKVDGARNGVSTTLQIKGRYRFDRKRRRIDWFGILVNEQRDIGHVGFGLDVVARLQMTITDATEDTRLTDKALVNMPVEPTPELLQLSYEANDGDWQFRHDRRWYVTRDRDGLAVLQLIDRGEPLAYCNVSTLRKLEPGQRIALSQFQADIQRGLGKNFGEFVRVSEFGNEADYQVYRVIVHGEVENTIAEKTVKAPMQWNYYLLTDRHGHRAVFAFTIEKDFVERFADADTKLINSLRFLDTPPLASRDKPAS